MARPAKETRENFEAAKVDAWSAGEWGHRVRVFAEKGRLKIRFQDPATGRTKQRTVFAADSEPLRRKATAVAVETAERIRSGQAAAVEAERQAPAQLEDLTVEDVAHLFMQRAPGFPRRLLTATKAEVEEWYYSLPAKVRRLETVPAPATLVRDVYGWRHLFADERFRPDRKVVDIDPADATSYAQDVVADGTSPRTAANDLDRLSSAFNHVRTQHRSIGLTYNPIEGRKVDRERADVDAYSREEGAAMWAAAPAQAEKGEWQVFVAVGIAAGSGRRLGSILGLTASDHDLEAGTVVWRAESAKGEHYGRGDEIRPLSALHRKAVEWVLEHHPNPLGPEHPLLWRTGGKTLPEHPDKPVPEQTIWGQLMRLEAAADVDHRDGRAWHAFRRWAVTHLADILGDGPAAEYVGMTVETLRKYGYKKVQAATMKRAADQLGGAFNEEDES